MTLCKDDIPINMTSGEKKKSTEVFSSSVKDEAVDYKAQAWLGLI